MWPLDTLLDNALDRVSSRQQFKVFPMVQNFSWLKGAQIGQRAESGQVLYEMLGSTRDFIHLDQLMLLPAQVARPPLFIEDDVEIGVTLGPRAAKPMRIEMPVIVTSCGFGFSVSKNVRLAIARAASQLGTAIGSGEIGFIEEERQIAGKYIVQYNRGRWNVNPQELSRADMTEIWVGQGAAASAPTVMEAEQIGPDLRRHLRLQEGQGAATNTMLPAVGDRRRLQALVDELRQATGGAPVAVKLAAGNVEADLEAAVAAGVDVISLDGAEAGTGSSPEVTINNFGLPLVYALSRASRYLDKHKLRGRVSLIVGGGIRDSGDVLKCLALGADAVYVGTAALLALIYTQLEKPMPWRNPVELFLYTAKEDGRLDVEKAARGLSNYLQATAMEIELGLRLLGKRKAGELDRSDLTALTKEVADITGVSRAY